MSKSTFSKADAVFRTLLKELRLEQRVTQVQLARRLGRPQSYVSKLETGDRLLDFVETAFLCEALGVKLEDVARIFTRRLKAARRRDGSDRDGDGV